MYAWDVRKKEREGLKKGKVSRQAIPSPLCSVSNRLTLSLVLEEEVAQKEEEEEKEKEDDEEEEAVQSLSVASGPSVEVGESEGSSITCGNGVCDCDGVRRKMKNRGEKTIEVELLEWVPK